MQRTLRVNSSFEFIVLDRGQNRIFKVAALLKRVEHARAFQFTIFSPRTRRRLWGRRRHRLPTSTASQEHPHHDHPNEHPERESDDDHHVFYRWL